MHMKSTPMSAPEQHRERSALSVLLEHLTDQDVPRGLHLARRDENQYAIAKLRIVQWVLELDHDDFEELFSRGDLGDLANLIQAYACDMRKSELRLDRMANAHDLQRALAYEFGGSSVEDRE